MTSSALVGRDSALADVHRALDGAAAGRGRLALVVGEAGIGKTALAREVADHAAGRGLGLLWATCWDGDGVPPYWPWVQVLRAHGGADAGHVLAELVGAVDDGSARSVLGDDARERFALFDAVASLLVRAARVRPLLVVLDDLQWADVPSLLLVDFLARQLPTAPILLLGAFRDDESDTDAARRDLLARIRGHGDAVALAGLAPADVARLMGSIAGASPDAGLAADVSRRTGGNPFFVREMTQLLVSRGGVGGGVPAAGRLPDGVRQVVTQRLARLPQACVSVLTAAAVIGPETGSDLLSRVAGTGVEELAERLDEAVHARVLTPPPGPAGPHRFAHDVFRETLYENLPADARADLHLRVARALADARDAGSRVHPAELAHHFLLAAVGRPATVGLGEEAVRYGVLAAEEATARLAYEDAAAHVRRQLDGLGPAGLLRDPARAELLLCGAEALRRGGDGPGARRDYREAVELARHTGEPATLGRAALGVHALGVESGASRSACVELLEEALDGLSGQDGALRARVCAALARELFLSGVSERARAARLSADAVETARRVGDDAALAVSLLAAHDTVWMPGTAGRRRVIAAEMGAVARRARDPAFEAEACLLRASAGLELGDAAGVADLEEFVALGTAVGQPRYTYLALTRRVTLATIAGRFAEAERLAAEAATLARTIGEPDAWNVESRELWELRSGQGRRAEIEARLRSLPVPQLRFWFDAMLGLSLLERGERPEALRLIGSAVTTRPEQLAFSYVLAAQWAEMGEAAAAAGRLDACARYYDALRPHAGTMVVTAAAVSFTGAVDHHLGVLAAALGRSQDAVAHFEAAVAMHERLPAWPWLARSRCELAAALVARGFPADRGRVTALLDEAGRAADTFGMPGVLRRVEEILLPPENVFRRDGDGWVLAYGGTEVRLRDVKGLGDIATLLAAAGQAVPALTLVAGAHAGAAASTDADPVLDRVAQRQYRARLAELDAELDDAEARHDLARAAATADERAFLIRELASAVGLGHRDRRLGDDRERARKAVAGRIRDALGRITAVHPTLGAHLDAAISTGTLCAYRPSAPTRWRSGVGAGSRPPDGI